MQISPWQISAAPWLPEFRVRVLKRLQAEAAWLRGESAYPPLPPASRCGPLLVQSDLSTAYLFLCHFHPPAIVCATSPKDSLASHGHLSLISLAQPEGLRSRFVSPQLGTLQLFLCGRKRLSAAALDLGVLPTIIFCYSVMALTSRHLSSEVV